MNLDGAYRIYLSLRLHFTDPKYDVRDTGGFRKIPGNKPVPPTFQKFVQRYQTKDWVEYLIANFTGGDNYGGVFTDGRERYTDWLKRKESRSYIFEQDLYTIHTDCPTLSDAWTISQGHPKLLQLYLGQHICLETLVIINKMYKYVEVVDAQLEDDPVWNHTSHLIKKYGPFVELETSKYSTIIQHVFS